MLRDCVTRSPKIRSGHVWLAATYAQMGQLELVWAEVAEVNRSISFTRRSGENSTDAGNTLAST